MSSATPRVRGGIFGQLYFQVLSAVVLGVLVGGLFPSRGVQLKFLADDFIWLIRLLLGPIIFGTIVVGIARMGSLREVGRIGLKAMVYFEIVSTLALGIGLVVINVVQPGVGMNVDARSLDHKSVAEFTSSASAEQPTPGESTVTAVTAAVARSIAQNHILQIIFASLCVGFALAHFRARTQPLIDWIDAALRVVFFVVGLVMRLAPLAALGGIGFTVGKYGLGTLASLGSLIASVYVTSLLFIFVVLGLIARFCGFSLWKFLRYIREEIIITFATVSTEAVLPRMMDKMENLGCAKPIVGLVFPAGYMFNPDGTAIYLTMATIFIAQATNTHLSFGDQLGVLAILLLTSKGSGGVAGAGFVALAATLSTQNKIPVDGLVLLLGVDRFINESRAVTNLIGNGVATLAISAWEKSLDRQRLADVLSRSGLESK